MRMHTKLLLCLWGTGVSVGALSAGPPVISPIKAVSIPSTNIETYGIWSEKQSNLGHKIWHKSTRTTVEELLSASWPAFSSPSLYKLALRVLLTSTEVPDPKGSNINLLELRAQRLYELGEITYAFDLIKGFSTYINPVLFNKIKFSALLTQQKYQEALKIAMIQAPINPDIFWQEAIIFCQLFIPDQQEAARLSLTLYMDNPKIADPEFSLLAQHILGKTHKHIPVSSTHSFMKVLLRLEANLLPDSLIAMVAPRYLALMHSYPGYERLPLHIRIRIQERIALFLPLPWSITLLQKIYEQATSLEACPFDAAADPLGNDVLLMADAPLARAHLFKLLSGATALPQKTAYAALLIKNTLQHNLLVPTAHLIKPFLEDLQPTDPSVTPYILLAKAVTQQKPDMTPTEAHIEDPVLLTILLLHYPQEHWDSYFWEHKAILEISPHRYALLGILYPWYKSLAHNLAIALWKPQTDFNPEIYRTPFLLNFLLGNAQGGKQKGEAIVLALLLSAHEDTSKNIGSLPLILKALHRSGLTKEAVDLATEKLAPMVHAPDLILPNPPVPAPEPIPVPQEQPITQEDNAPPK